MAAQPPPPPGLKAGWAPSSEEKVFNSLTTTISPMTTMLMATVD